MLLLIIIPPPAPLKAGGARELHLHVQIILHLIRAQYNNKKKKKKKKLVKKHTQKRSNSGRALLPLELNTMLQY